MYRDELKIQRVKRIILSSLIYPFQKFQKIFQIYKRSLIYDSSNLS